MLGLIPKSYEVFALDFANTYDPYIELEDVLTDADALKEFLKHQGYGVSKGKILSLGRSLKAPRDLLRKVVVARSDQKARKMLLPMIVGSKWKFEIFDKRRDVLVLTTDTELLKDQIIQTAAIGMISLIDRLGVMRLRHCKASPCEEIFSDESKSARQAFCSKRCSNRYGVAQYRARISK